MHQVFEEEMLARFGIPEEFGIVVTPPIGVPLGRFGPVRCKPAEEVTYFDAWGATRPWPGENQVRPSIADDY